MKAIVSEWHFLVHFYWEQHTVRYTPSVAALELCLPFLCLPFLSTLKRGKHAKLSLLCCDLLQEKKFVGNPRGDPATQCSGQGCGFLWTVRAVHSQHFVLSCLDPCPVHCILTFHHRYVCRFLWDDSCADRQASWEFSADLADKSKIVSAARIYISWSGVADRHTLLWQY